MMKPSMKKMMMKIHALFYDLGFAQALPLPGAPKMPWFNTISYGAISPL